MKGMFCLYISVCDLAMRAVSNTISYTFLATAELLNLEFEQITVQFPP